MLDMNTKTRKLKQEIGQRILQARNEAGILTNVELAVAIEKAMKGYEFSISETGLSALIGGGSSPRALTCLAFKKALGVSLDWLIAGEKPPESKKVERAIDDLRSFLDEIHPKTDPELHEIMELLKRVPPDRYERVLKNMKDFLDLAGK